MSPHFHRVLSTALRLSFLLYDSKFVQEDDKLKAVGPEQLQQLKAPFAAQTQQLALSLIHI